MAQVQFAPSGALRRSTARCSDLTPRLASALCYFPLLAILFLAMPPHNRDPEVRFHAWQCLGLVVSLTAVQVGFSIVGIALESLAPAFVEPVDMLSAVVLLCGLLLLLVSMVMAYHDTPLAVPVVRRLAERFA
jgi:uncharacterized membrane protein